MFDSPSDDCAIRLEAGEWVKNYVATHGDEVERDVLLEGFRFRGQRIPLVDARRGIRKPHQMEFPLSIMTSFKNPYEDTLDLETGFLSYRYFGKPPHPHHPENRGLRDLIGVQRPLIYLRGLRPGRYLLFWPVFIVADDPSAAIFSVAVETPAFAEDQLRVQQSGALLAAEGRVTERRYATRTAKVRLQQGVFRHRVLPAYRNSCAFCRLRQVSLLDAAHIVPYSDPASDPVVPNGMALCKIHHAAFDDNLIGVTPDYEMRVREDVRKQKDGPMLKHGLQGLHSEPIRLPRARENHPDREALERRYQKFKKAS